MLDRRDIEGQRLLDECVRERAFAASGEPEPYLPDFEEFARSVLGWRFSPTGYAGLGDSAIPPELEVNLQEYREVLRPRFAVRELDPANGGVPWQLLVTVLDPGGGPRPRGHGRGSARGLAPRAHGALAAPHRGSRRAALQRARHPADVRAPGREFRVDGLPGRRHALHGGPSAVRRASAPSLREAAAGAPAGAAAGRLCWKAVGSTRTWSARGWPSRCSTALHRAVARLPGGARRIARPASARGPGRGSGQRVPRAPHRRTAPRVRALRRRARDVVGRLDVPRLVFAGGTV